MSDIGPPRRPAMPSHRLCLLGWTLGLLFTAPAGAAAPDFERDVRPILVARCGGCHGEAKQRGGLDLRSRAAMIKGGDTGPALVPHSASKSLLYQKIVKGEMPPEKEPR